MLILNALYLKKTNCFNNISIIFKINNGMLTFVIIIMIITSLIHDIDDTQCSFIIYLLIY